MTREKAVAAARVAYAATLPPGERFVAMAEAIGLIKFEEPADMAETIVSAMVIHPTADAPPDSGWMIGPYGARKIMARLAGAGFKVTRA